MRLSIKILSAFVLTALVSVALTVGVIRYFAFRDFQDYVHGKELERVRGVLPLLTAHYQARGGWEGLVEDQAEWADLLRRGLAEGGDKSVSRAERPLRGDRPPRPNPPLRPGAGGPPAPGAGPPRPEDDPGPDPARRPPPLESPIWDTLHLVPRLALFDPAKNLLAGPRIDLREPSWIALEVEGKTVGWLGLGRGREFNHPLDKAFIQRQSRVFYLIGAMVAILAAAASLALSRLLTAPLRRLAGAARNLRKRRFETRIEAGSSDELGLLAREFNSLARELGRYEKRQQQWLSDISHELRTPLSVLIGEIEAIQDGVREADPRTLASLHAEADHLAQIVEDLHQLSLAEAGGLSFHRRETAPLAVLAETLELWEGRLARAGFELVRDFDPALPVTLEGDPVRLTQVFANLLQNVINHAASPGRVVLSALAGEDRLVIGVEDSGPGVAGEELERLFDRLYKADPSRSRSGSGLGLAVARAVVEAHGGTIRALAGQAGGLRVEVELPLNRDRKAAQKEEG